MTRLTPEERAELRAACEKSVAAYEGWRVRPTPAMWAIYEQARVTWIEEEEVLALLDEINAQAARIAELEVTAERRGRCSKHKDEPGPSLYFDCCESERLRGLVRHRDERVAELEAKVAAQDKTLRSWVGPVAGYAEDPAQQLKWAQERIAELEKELAGAKQLLGMFEAEAKAKGLAVDVMLDAMNEETP